MKGSILLIMLVSILVSCGRNSSEVDEERNKFQAFLLAPYDGVAIRDITWNIPLQSNAYSGKADLRCFDFIKIHAKTRRYVNIISCYLLDKLHGPLMPEEPLRIVEVGTIIEDTNSTD